MIDARTTEDGYPALREVFEEMTKAGLAIHAATLAHRMTVYLHSNWRGDVVMATDTAGNVVGEYAYTTFGEQLSATGTYTPRFSFSSKERDASGLVYFGFRHCSPVLCRWISEDPIRESGGFNLYQFCGNDPVNRVDPQGTDIYYSSGFGAHSVVIVDDPTSVSGRTSYEFAPRIGGRNNLTLNVLYGRQRRSWAPRLAEHQPRALTFGYPQHQNKTHALSV